MSVDPSHPISLTSKWFKPSHRTRAEQGVGFAIFLLVGLLFALFNKWLFDISSQGNWKAELFKTYGSLAIATYCPVWTVSLILAAFAMWNLWRRYSLNVLQLELSMFLFQFFLQEAWSFSFFILHEILLGLVAALFLFSNAFLSALLYWKKECIAGFALIFPFLWIFYLMVVNMMICISSP